MKRKTPSLEKLNSPEFVARLRTGEETAFRELNAELFSKFTTFAQKEFAMTMEDAEDLAQETVITVFRKIKLFDPKRGSFLSWVFRILRNRCVDWLRKRKRMPSTTDIIAENMIQEDSSSPSDDLSALEKLPPHVRQAILRLPGRYQQFIGLRLLNVTDDYLMQIMQIKTRATLRSLKSRAYAKLRVEIQRTS